jgi:Catechol dioxygenase N terminus
MNAMRDINEDTITQAVIASMDDQCDSRLRTIIASLVQHLHSFACEVKLTEAEWFRAIQFLTETGHITDDKRQEFILLSDTLRLSMLVMAQNNKKPAHGRRRNTCVGGRIARHQDRFHEPLGAQRAVCMAHGCAVAYSVMWEWLCITSFVIPRRKLQSPACGNACNRVASRTRL